ncbi:hypothetical protein C808_00441 [Lachnospiraceae bacterium M18-1]|nr:hypothetical protein C808_00441 [Lachnospiraceae bacterium M18-1]
MPVVLNHKNMRNAFRIERDCHHREMAAFFSEAGGLRFLFFFEKKGNL